MQAVLSAVYSSFSADYLHVFARSVFSKALNYSYALEHFGPDIVHRHVGHEPSGDKFDALILNKKDLPHNPLINSGAIMIASLLRPDLGESARFDYMLQMWQRMAGGKKFEYDNKVFLS